MEAQRDGLQESLAIRNSGSEHAIAEKKKQQKIEDQEAELQLAMENAAQLEKDLDAALKKADDLKLELQQA